MDGIPPPQQGDPEEVAWALETAETLWKRGDRVDAVVWVRRAAAAAEDFDDPGRAALLRTAASDLSVWIGSTTRRPPGESEKPARGAADELDALLVAPLPKESSEIFTLTTNDVELLSTKNPADTASTFPELEVLDEHETNFPSRFPDEEPTPIRRDLRSGTPPQAVPVAAAAPAPNAATAHAGMLDPWADGDRRKRAVIPREEDDERPTLTFEAEEVITSAKRQAVYAPAGGLREEAIPRPPPAPHVSSTRKSSREPLPEEAETTTYRQVSPRTVRGPAASSPSIDSSAEPTQPRPEPAAPRAEPSSPRLDATVPRAEPSSPRVEPPSGRERTSAPPRWPSMGPLTRNRSAAPKGPASVKPSAAPPKPVEAPTKQHAVVPPAAIKSVPPDLDLLEMIDATAVEEAEPSTRPVPPPLPAAARASLAPSQRLSPSPTQRGSVLPQPRPTHAPLAMSSRPTALPPRATSSLPAGALPSAAPPSDSPTGAPPAGSDSPTGAPPVGSDSPTGAPPGTSGVPTAAPPGGTPAAGVTASPPSDSIARLAASSVLAAPPAPHGRKLDLDAVEALTDLPDDARAAFLEAATIHTIARDEEVSHFALALVASGEIDVSATIVDTAALRLEKNAVLRSRGTVVPGVPLRLVCASDEAVVATWDDAAVEQAFRSCPWVEEDLRSVADRVQAQAGVTMGPLGDRFDQSLRAHFTSKLSLRTLAPGEILVEKGKPTPLALVGVGEIVVEVDGARTETLRSGDIVFPQQVLAHAPAQATASAGPGGAVLLFGDRAVAQELLMSFPPLLEVLATM